MDDASGSFPLGKAQLAGGWLSAVDACLRSCHACSNCRHVSISLKYSDCSWFRSCNYTRLRGDISTFRSAAVDAGPLGNRSSTRSRAWKRGVGLGVVSQMDSAHDALDALQLGRPPALSQALPYPLTKPLHPILLLGLISGNADRRDLLRCTWVGALPRSIRVRFVVGRNHADDRANDVLFVAVDENVDLTSARRFAPSGRAGGPLPSMSGAQTWTQYAKVVAFLRYAATQPEPLIAKGDDDIYVQPQLLEAYAHLLLHNQTGGGDSDMAASQASVPIPPKDIYAGVFEWYSWIPHTLENVNWGRNRLSASYASGATSFTSRKCREYWCNCSSSGGGWGWDGFELREGPAAEAEAANRTCIGPYAFAKGALKFLSADVVRWMAASARLALVCRPSLPSNPNPDSSPMVTSAGGWWRAPGSSGTRSVPRSASTPRPRLPRGWGAPLRISQS